MILSPCHIAQWKSAGHIARDVGSYPTVACFNPQCPNRITMVVLIEDVHVTNIKWILHGNGHEHL